ncbi:hypothetical protein E0Z10_g10718 [Xylaria hypoxylon]|uniref:Protein kinase domain-containing protein n=1 Tax=Xylaria hypoxylon TaxID=37992 RepID=A0A4Z0YDP8_9PEZI|nr:hypothetical protein E0Z10_g10718 [Xylaria hypoxylon]
MIQPPTTAALPADSQDMVTDTSLAGRPRSLPALSPGPRISIEQIADVADEAASAPQFCPAMHNAPTWSSKTCARQISRPYYPVKPYAASQADSVPTSRSQNAKYTNDDIDGRSHNTVNQYEIGDEIGRGSYGAVHLATDQFGNEYAVKEFSKSRLRKRAQSYILRRPGPGMPHHRGPGMGLNNFHRKQFGRQEDAEAKDALYLIRAEIAIMKKLNHPNLVALIEVLDDPEDDSLYMVLEMCKKGVVTKIDLGQHATPYESELCRTWFRDLILGIEYLHAQGIIHRDIKPDNLLLTEDDVLKIVDFGVSEMFEKTNEMMTNKSAGSPAFIPPELCQARHGDVPGKAADVWSMGVTLYCLKYGKLPFTGDSVLDMYETIREKPFSLPDGEDPDFVDLITRILDKNNTTRITLREIRNHPWVTRNGADPLLSEEENCSDMVETPNELEVNHAFTRKMDHLICVLRAIQRFKGLISQSRASTPRTHHTTMETKAEPPTSYSSSNQTPETAEPARQKSVAEEAAELIEQRNAYLQSSLHLRAIGSEQKVGEELQIPGPAEKDSMFLGIGTGGDDELSTSEDPIDFVSESPTGIEFDVYDRAFETEIKRIRSDRKRNRSWTYMTKLLGEKEKEKYAGDDCMITEAGKSLGSATVSKASSLVHGAQSHREEERAKHTDAPPAKSEEGVQRVAEAAKETVSRLADLVVSMTNDMKGKETARENND